MSRRLTHQMTYAAPLAQVVEMLADPRFREGVCEYQRVVSADVEIDRSGDAMTVLIEQVQPAAGIPSFAKKFVGDEIRIVQREDWSAPDTAELHVTIPGKPGHMDGTITLVESGGTTVETVDVEIRVNLPLVGGKIEGLVSDLLRKALVAEEKVGARYLSA
ncbi:MULTISPECIES: DUF2505 domain-containing protein [unclassified Nocardioides]|uniref:DUF2505 domain-containing protein n=1 Tax=unclassified Nocardioides TaxID=2615069 RepID=UPI000056FFBD|nr:MULTISPECIES: DUF2505 domain-containing protein [unclassified Nocardioides]ABL80736.1 hypothetical protein Noca_1222 [Nocardioides sp. JS614]